MSSRRFGLETDRLVFGCGSDEIFQLLNQVFLGRFMLAADGLASIPELHRADGSSLLDASRLVRHVDGADRDTGHLPGGHDGGPVLLTAGGGAIHAAGRCAFPPPDGTIRVLKSPTSRSAAAATAAVRNRWPLLASALPSDHETCAGAGVGA